MTKVRASWIAGLVLVAAAVGAGTWLMHNYRSISDDYEATRVHDVLSEKGKPGEEPEEVGEWSTYHGDAALTGAVSTALPDRFALLWRFRAGAAVSNTPVVAAGRVFVANARGEVLAADLQGELLWSVALTKGVNDDGTPQEEVIDAPLACFDEVLLVGTADGTLYALDAADGDEKWRYEVGGPILGTPNLSPVPAADEGTDRAAVVVVSQSDGALHCIGLADGQPIWRTEGISRCDGSPAVGDGLVVFGSCAAALHVFSAGDGRLERDIEIGADSQVAGGVAVRGDTVFAGSRSGRVLRANLRTGNTLWVNEDCEDEVFTTPAVSRDWVVFASDTGRIYALDRETGRERWKFDTGGTPSSPVIAGDKVVVTSDGFLHLLRLKDGAPVWSREVSDVITGPAVVGRMIIVGSEDGIVTAFADPTA